MTYRLSLGGPRNGLAYNELLGGKQARRHESPDCM